MDLSRCFSCINSNEVFRVFSVWLSTHDHTSIVSERLTVPHLPVNPELSTTRNQVFKHYCP